MSVTSSRIPRRSASPRSLAFRRAPKFLDRLADWLKCARVEMAPSVSSLSTLRQQSGVNEDTNVLRCSRLAHLEFGSKLHDGVSFLPGQAKDLTAGPARQRSEETVENLSPHVNHVEPSRSKLGVLVCLSVPMRTPSITSRSRS